MFLGFLVVDSGVAFKTLLQFMKFMGKAGTVKAPNTVASLMTMNNFTRYDDKS